MYRRTALTLITAIALTACTETPPTNDQGHGAIAGAAEVAEPQLHLVSIDAEGKTSMLDLLNGTETALPDIETANTVTTDGRYVFATNETGVSIIDSGVWTWDHVDHFHYYRAEPRMLGRVEGHGEASISTGMLSTAGNTGMFFPTSGEAVLLDNKALSEGRISETFRLKGTPHAGLIAPLGQGALVSESEDGVVAARLNVTDADGETQESIDCAEASGTITTRVGLVVGCADGAVLATGEGLEKIPYPAGAAAPATSFAGRKGRPTVAGIGDGTGIWLLDTRERSWHWLETTTPVQQAAAVDDAETHVVAVGKDGSVQVYDAEGSQLAVTKPLVDSANADLMVDGQRAYVNDVAEGVVYEIDYADRARVARELELKVKPVHLAETGR
jgi:hypothetical protein